MVWFSVKATLCHSWAILTLIMQTASTLVVQSAATASLWALVWSPGALENNPLGPTRPATLNTLPYIMLPTRSFSCDSCSTAYTYYHHSLPDSSATTTPRHDYLRTTLSRGGVWDNRLWGHVTRTILYALAYKHVPLVVCIYSHWGDSGMPNISRLYLQSLRWFRFLHAAPYWQDQLFHTGKQYDRAPGELCMPVSAFLMVCPQWLCKENCWIETTSTREKPVIAWIVSPPRHICLTAITLGHYFL